MPLGMQATAKKADESCERPHPFCKAPLVMRLGTQLLGDRSSGSLQDSLFREMAFQPIHKKPFVEALGDGWKCAHLVQAREEGTVIKSSILAGR